ncbi:hypothetical protein [Arthrospiribacter ruber]|uniref:Uncharacterized protein n=1 Tax=Arthrospiribacter ruber TaxID=2487934 RepID=A0A951MCG5_9BACT|nr:hypothetical protein [Arthrospiribacter ruber]MBW3466356.1 hypothetical protein [Arthrospiribacter ruber]
MATRYSQKERIIAKYLSAFPGAKQALKKAYQWANYLVYKPKFDFLSDFEVKALESLSGETFFGYYDKSPESPCGNYLLYHLSQRNTKKIPSGTQPIEVVCMSIDSNQVVYSRITNAYNWQQGARLHWVKKDSFVYNVFEPDKGYGSILVTLKENNEPEEIELSRPIYDSCSGFALSLSFEKLNKLRPDYGYRCHPNSVDLSNPEEGIFISQEFNNQWKPLLTLKGLNQEYPIHNGVEGAEVSFDSQKFNHIMISPDEKKFVFLHRYYVGGKRIDRLFCYDLSSKYLKMLSKDEMVSHYCWINDNLLMVYMRDDSTAGDNYYILDVSTGESKTMDILQNEFGDGHPNAHAGNLVVFDTYPNKSRMKELFILDLANSQITKLGEFLEPMSYYGETRCDLHPRFNYSGTKVYFDSVHSGKRQQHWIALTK